MPEVAVRCPLSAARCPLLVVSGPIVAPDAGRRPPPCALPNGLPMCRRTGSIGCSLNQAWAVGTMGLLDTLSAEVIANVAVPDAGRSLVDATVVVAPLVVTSPTARPSPLDARSPLSVVRRWFSRRSRPD